MKSNSSCQTIKSYIMLKPSGNLLSLPKQPLYYINMLKNKKIIFHSILRMRNRNEISNTFRNYKSQSLNLIINPIKKEEKKLPKIFPYSYRVFDRNKKTIRIINKSVNSIKKYDTDMESYFTKIKKEANMLNSKNKNFRNIKKMIFDKNKFDKLKKDEKPKVSMPKIKIKKLHFRNFFSKDNSRFYNNSEFDKNFF